MRTIALLLLMLASAGQLAARIEMDSPAPLPAAQYTDWVRTTRGWEKLDTLPTVSPTPIFLHPAIVASGQLLASLLALVAWSGRCS